MPLHLKFLPASFCFRMDFSGSFLEACSCSLPHLTSHLECRLPAPSLHTLYLFLTATKFYTIEVGVWRWGGVVWWLLAFLDTGLWNLCPSLKKV
jgi:hypothetical protein